MDDDPIDSLWDELCPPRQAWPRPDAIVPYPAGFKVDPILEIDDLPLSPQPHLVLAWTWADLGKALDRLRAKTHPRATVDKLTSHLPCLLLGNEHWKNIETGLDVLHKRGCQAFIGTMNTCVIDWFFFTSAEDARMRVLFGNPSGTGLSRMTENDADRFYRAYAVGIQMVSEVLRTEGIW